MKKVRLERDNESVYLRLTDDEGREITVQLGPIEAQNLGEGLFTAGRMVEVHTPKP